mgnify:FL=1
MKTSNVIKVKTKLSKIVKNSNGEIINYVDNEWARKRGLWNLVNHSNRYPLNERFVEITKPIKRV